MAKSKIIYSYEEDTKAVAFVDIIGFSRLTEMITQDPLSPAGLALGFFEDCILRYRSSTKKVKPRETSTSISGSDFLFKTTYVWHREVPEGAVNFVYMSDCSIFYSNSLTHLFQVLSAVFGAAITHAVPIRAAVTTGSLHHSEWIERPGTGISLYGAPLTRAVKLEGSIKGAGMRVWLEPAVVELAKSHGLSELIIRSKCLKPAELKWWLGAYAPVDPQLTESGELERQFQRWFTEKHTKNWFSGPNCRRTQALIKRAVKELNSLGR